MNPSPSPCAKVNRASKDYASFDAILQKFMEYFHPRTNNGVRKLFNYARSEKVYVTHRRVKGTLRSYYLSVKFYTKFNATSWDRTFFFFFFFLTGNRIIKR